VTEARPLRRALLRQLPPSLHNYYYGNAGFIDTSPEVNGTFRNPSGLACDAAGNIWVADTGNHAVRRVAPDGTITTVAGNGACALTDGVGIAAQFCSPQGITVAPSGDIVVADTNNLALRRIRVSGSNASPTYTVTTVTTGGLTGVSAVQADSAGNIYVALQ
jgi:sugar lactone lactonase YvrE